jgi:tetratricopeptide (TPR) repeat protein
MNQYDKAVEQLTKSLDLFQKVGDLGGEVDVLNRLGETHSLWGRPSEAAGYLNEALTLTRNRGDLAGEAKTLSNLASVNARSNQFQQAVDLYRQSLSAYEKTGKEGGTDTLDGELQALQGLASVFRSQGQNDLAMEHFNKALDLAKKAELSAKKSKEPKELLDAYTRMGKAYEKLGDLKKAKQYYSSGLKEAESVSKNAKRSSKGSQTKSKSGGLDASEAMKGLDRIKAKMEKKKAKTAAASER